MKSEIDILICRCLAGESSHSDEEMLIDWINASDDNMKYFLRMKNIWDISGKNQDNDSPFDRIMKISDNASLSGKSSPCDAESDLKNNVRNSLLKRISRFSAAAVFVIMAMSSAYLLIDKFSTKAEVTYSEIVTPYGSKSSFTLPDGSQVCLNSGSTIKYSSDIASAKERIVTVSGEAFFKVKSDKAHPFIVNAGNIKVTATGTSFNVRCYESSVREYVSLLDGVVEVEAGKWNCSLKPNQTAVYDKTDDNAVIDLSSAADCCSWVDGKLVFSGVKLSEILDRLEEVYSVEIIMDRRIEDNLCYATFSNESIDRILSLLSHIAPIKYCWTDTHKVEVTAR